jgi:hypothetical protein
MWRAVFALLACASCDKIWGLDSVGLRPADAPAPPDAADLGTVSGHYTQRWFGLDVQSNVFAHADEFTMADVSSALVTLDDGTTRAVVIGDTDFSFTTPNQGDHYSLRIETPVGSRTWNLSTAQLELVERYTYPPNRATVMAGTLLQLDMDATTVHHGLGSKEELDTIGTWSRTQVGTATSALIQVDCSTRDAYGVQIGAIAPPSAAFYTATEPVAGGYNQLTVAGRVDNVMTIDGATSTYPQSPATVKATAVNLSGCTKVLVHGTEEAQRNQDAVPGASPGISAWFVDIDPALDFGFLPTALPVAGGQPNGTTVNATYGNPFGMGQADVLMSSVAANLGTGAASQSVVVEPVGTDHCTNTVEIHDGLIALPMNVQLGGVALVTALQVVTVGGSHMEIAWDTAAAGTADAYIVFLDQVINGTTITIETITTTDKVVSIPTAELMSGGEFQIRVVAAIGFPNVRAGDLVTAAAPVGVGVFKTPLFKIQ